MPSKGLGTGLGALLGDAALEETMTATEYLPIAHIEPRTGQPRKEFDEEALQELCDSIREHGIIQPIVVRPLKDGYYQIIAGERRWRAARMANLREVPVRILEADEKSVAEMALVENLQREDLNPVEEARGYEALRENYGMTQEQIGQRVGKSRPVITNALRLLQLPEEILKLLQDGTLNMSVARALLELEDEALRKKAAKKIVEDCLTVREATLLIKRLSEGKEEEEKKEKHIDPYVRDVETRLGRRFGTKVRIEPGKKKGTITLDYYGEEDLNRLIALLNTDENEE